MGQEAKNAKVMQTVMDIIGRRDFGSRLKKYDGFVIIDEVLLSGISTQMGGGIAFTDVNPSALTSPLDIAVFRGEIDQKPDTLMRARKADPKTIRKMTNVFTPNGYTLDTIHLNDGYERRIALSTAREQQFKDSKLVVPHGCVVNAITEGEVQWSVQALAGVQFLIENTCAVYLKPDDAEIGFTLPLWSLDEAKWLFKMRDVEPGRKRRKALEHFVREHLRRLPSNPEESIKIARHLRGAKTFDWNGFHCSIRVPEFLTQN